MCRRLLTGASLLSLAACATAPVGHEDLLSFLADGVTRKEEVELKLGRPNADFEDYRILTFRIGRDKAGYFLAAGVPTDWAQHRYSLVLVFDADGTLTRHALVAVAAK